MLTQFLVDQFNQGNISSTDIFQLEYNLYIVSLKVQCPNCGHTWTVRSKEVINSTSKGMFKCTNCLK